MIDLSNTIFKTYDDVEVKDMNSYEDILEFVEEENVKFIRLAFFDVFGVQKNIAIMPDELKRAFSEGLRRGCPFRHLPSSGSDDHVDRAVASGRWPCGTDVL